MKRYRQRVEILMPEMDSTSDYPECEYELWSSALPQYFSEEVSGEGNFFSYPKPIPSAVLIHYEKARATGAFEKFTIFAAREFEFSLMLGCTADHRVYKLATWHPSTEKALSVEVLRQRVQNGSLSVYASGGGIIFS